MFTHVDPAFDIFFSYMRYVHSSILVTPFEYEGTSVEVAEEHERSSVFASEIKSRQPQAGYLDLLPVEPCFQR